MPESNLELEAAILADPDARAGYEVYADWLAERGDPRGELMSVQLARELVPDDVALVEREKQLLQQVGHWLGVFEAGSPWPGRQVDLRWRRGFVDAATIRTGYETQDSAMWLADLAALPVARGVRELTLGVAYSYNGRGTPDVSIVEALRDAKFPLLQRLALDCFDSDVSWSHVGDLSIANAALQRVEWLEVLAGYVDLGAIEMPRVHKIRIETGGLRPIVPASIAAARWPALESLVLYFGTPDYGGTCEPNDVRAILDGENLPHVRTLGLCNSMFGDALPELVARSRILPRLTHLDLSLGTLGSDGAQAILRNADAFAHLIHLDLSNNYLSPSEADELTRVAHHVDVTHQKTEDGYGRYVTVSE